MQFTQKETQFLQDLKSEEQLCADKYKKNAEAAHDQQLKDLFNQIESVERQHISTLTSIENGNIPTPSNTPKQMPTFTATYSMAESQEKADDCYLCSDVLTTEKHASSLYNTAIFEFKDKNIRNMLNSIQKEEQEHGEMIYNYMQTNSMYS